MKSADIQTLLCTATQEEKLPICGHDSSSD